LILIARFAADQMPSSGRPNSAMRGGPFVKRKAAPPAILASLARAGE
jgi:hypothetical protein